MNRVVVSPWSWVAGSGAVALVALLLAGVAVSAQSAPPSQQQAPTFRSGTTVVPLTVTVLDQKGQPVTDLQASDFTVYENRRQREIVNFFPQALTPGLVQPPGARGDGMAPATRRTFVIVLSGGRGDPAKPFDGAARFVREHLLPQDAVALMAFNRTTPFTTDHEAIARMIERYKAQHEQLYFDYRLSDEKSLFGNSGRPKPEKVLADMDAVLAGAGELRTTSDLLFAMDRAIPPDEKPWQRQDRLSDVLSALNGRSLAGLVNLSNRFKLFAGIEYLRDRDGEKHLLFIASSGLARDADDAKIVARRATDARVIVHMAGTSGQFGWSSRDVVELTGGYYTSLEYADKALARLDTSTRFTYLLGYTPVNPTLDGKYRDVNVTVNRPNVIVRFRHGYTAAVEPDPVELKELIVKSRLEAALAYDQDSRDIVLGVQAAAMPRMGIQSMVRVEVTIDASKLEFDLKDGVRTGRLELQVYVGDAKERLVGEFGEGLDINVGEDTYQDFLKSGIRRAVRVSLIGVPKYVKVVVYDYGSDRVGSAMLTLK